LKFDINGVQKRFK